MKTANVVSVKSRDSDTATAPASRGSRHLGRMADLLRSYPDIADAGRAELLEFLTRGAPEDIVQVTHMQGLEARFAVFRKDHPREFPQGLRGWLPMILLVAVATLGLIWRLAGFTI